eukprot:357494-Chlamydomonas_euryale.AAC.8
MLPPAHLVPDHAAARGMRKVEVVVVADERLWVRLCQLRKLLAISGAWAIGLRAGRRRGARRSRQA